MEKELQELAADLKVPTYRLGIGESNPSYCRGWNEGQAASGKRIEKLLKKQQDNETTHN